MASTINASTSGAGGLITTADASGQLELQTAGTTRVTVDSSGNVGIGTSSPASPLTVEVPTEATTAAIFRIAQSATPTGEWNAVQINANAIANGQPVYLNWDWDSLASAVSIAGVKESTTDARLQFYTTTGDVKSERMRITSAGEVYIAGTTDRGAFNLQCNGTGVWGAGAYTNGSDARIKDDITPIDSGLDVVGKLNPVTYRYKKDWSKDQSVQTGFIAQELLVALEGKSYVDGIVQQGGEYMSVAYQNIIPILTKAIQELKAIVDEQAEKIKALEGK